MHACYILKIVQDIIFFLIEILRFHSRTESYGSITFSLVYGSSRLSNHFWKFRSNFCTSATVLLYCRCQVNVCAYCLNREKQNTT